MRTYTTNFWVISDTHCGHKHKSIIASRGENFEDSIFKEIRTLVKPNDILLCLGDYSFYNFLKWQYNLIFNCSGKKWLIKGNHDHKSTSWYLSNGWDFVADEMLLDIYGYRLLFTHIPKETESTEYDFNIHGHLHEDTHRLECTTTKQSILVTHKLVN